MKTIVLLSVAPAAILALIVYKMDKDKEPRKLLAQLIGLGVLSTLLTLLLTFIFGQFSALFNADPFALDLKDLFLYVFVTNASIEEYAKLIFIYYLVWKHKEFDQTYDAIVYSVFVALGFAALENIIYVISSVDTLYKVAAIRAVTAVPAHAIFGVYMGFLVSRAKIAYKASKSLKKYIYIVLSLFIPALLHAIYNWILFAQFSIIIFIIYLMFLFISGLFIVKKEAKYNKNL